MGAYLKLPRMTPIETDQAVVLEPRGTARASVIWLHGLGADGHDFVPIVPELGLPADHGVRFVFPHAPVRPITINNGYAMRGWYDIVTLGNLKQQDEKGIRDSERIVHGYIEDERAHGIEPSKIVIAGFSQGGAITLHTGLRYPEKLAGLLALSTYLPLGDMVEAEARAERKDTPILMCHGSHDQMLPMVMGQYTRDALRELGYQVDWHEYPMAHQVCAEEIEVIGDWFRQRLSI
jgi:phospholipase/carboxylesterase